MKDVEPDISSPDQILGDVASVGADGQIDKKKQQEYAAVKKNVKEYDSAREFDKNARRRYAIDRRYAAGTADTNWAVSANLIGSFIDILVSFLYARNPDVSVKKSPQVNAAGTKDMEDFAKTLEIVISKLWKNGRLKESARRMVRSGLTTGPGWLKVILIAEGTNLPQMEAELGDVRDNMARLEALKAELQIVPEVLPPDDTFGSLLMGDGQVPGTPGVTVPDPMWAKDQGAIEFDLKQGDEYEKCELSPEEFDAKMAELTDLQASLDHKVEVALRKFLAIDFIPSDCMQVSLDVRALSEYRNAAWVSNDIYRTTDEAKGLFPKLTDEDLKTAKKYFQKRSRSVNITADTIFNAENTDISAADADQFTSGTENGSSTEEGDAQSSVSFVKITERWDKRTNHVYTTIDGVKCWAVAPYQPDYPTSRFYPYFQVAFFDVDGERHSQSLPGRLYKLQDEYSASRSSFRLMRQRATPGVVFNASGLTDEDMNKIKNSTEQEFIGIKPVNPETPLQNLFAPKPYERVDPRMYDNTPILADMEKLSGVQEALQSSSSPEKTATEAEIQQSGFASRTTADRDVVEEMLNELALYTAQLAIGGIPTKEVQRMAGAGAYWPEGMALEDLLTLVEVDVVAGTTGKPKAMGDREAWGVLLPQIKEAIVQIQQAQTMGNIPLADAIKELLRETMVRMGDDTDIDRFIPAAMQPEIDPVTGLPIAPPAAGPGAAATPQPAGPVDPAAAGAAPVAGEELAVPELTAPAL